MLIEHESLSVLLKLPQPCGPSFLCWVETRPSYTCFVAHTDLSIHFQLLRPIPWPVQSAERNRWPREVSGLPQFTQQGTDRTKTSIQVCECTGYWYFPVSLVQSGSIFCRELMTPLKKSHNPPQPVSCGGGGWQRSADSWELFNMTEFPDLENSVGEPG